MAKFSAATDHALSVIAHVSMAQGMTKNVKGMDGFAEFYKKQMPPKDKEVMRRFEAFCQKAHVDLSKMLQQELQSDGQ
ncbi:MAG: hypothetical protein RIR18_2463 [Pseudomonadota bacterium]|jgi:hypothetical protein